MYVVLYQYISTFRSQGRGGEVLHAGDARGWHLHYIHIYIYIYIYTHIHKLLFTGLRLRLLFQETLEAGGCRHMFMLMIIISLFYVVISLLLLVVLSL